MIEQIFTQARSHKYFDNTPVSREALEEIWSLAKLAPTAFNCCPFRVVNVTTTEGMAKFVDCLVPGNRPKAESAQAAAILCYDMDFAALMPQLAPFMGERPYSFEQGPVEELEQIAVQNGTIQAAFWMAAARAKGWDLCPMGGFDKAKITTQFLEGTQWKPNWVCLVGRGTTQGLHPRGPRPTHAQALRWA